ncbi:glycosyl hydrolase family 2, partial [bacterium]|nr:glycosyl hydrolase family 2 [bacterium]
GRWKIKLDPMTATDHPQKMRVETESDIITLKNILVGEVWICSGQSNMEWPMFGLENPEKEMAAATDSKIRFIAINKFNFKPYECDDCIADWQECSPQSIKNRTAVGYYFARELRKKLNVPVGLIESYFGATKIEAWTPAYVLNKWPELREELAELSKYENNKKFNSLKNTEKEKWFDELKKFDIGFSENWMDKNTPLKDWKKINLPASWNSTKKLKDFKGTVWFRKNFSIPEKWKNKSLILELAAIEEYNITWLSGKEIGLRQMPEMSWYHCRYEINNSDFKAGENTIVVCDYNKNASGGLTGPKHIMRIFPKGEINQAIPLDGEWLYKKGYTGTALPDPPLSLSIARNTISVLYNSMIAPVIPFGIRGALWYQGESNRYNYDKYREMFSDMIESWRENWDQGDFPFYYAQIAPFNYNDSLSSALLQEAQLFTLKTTNTGMAVTMDIGDLNDIHPKNKKDVGYRLALWALAKDYGFTNIVFSGPIYKTMKVDGNKIILSFDYADGLKTRDGKALTDFEIAGKNKKFYPAMAEIKNNKVVISSDKIKNPVAVRYGWSDIAEPNLCNKENLPASSFRTY